MIKRLCDICGAEMEKDVYNGLTLDGKRGYGEDRRHIYCKDICYACSTALIDTIEEMRAAHGCAAHDAPGKEEA